MHYIIQNIKKDLSKNNNKKEEYYLILPNITNIDCMFLSCHVRVLDWLHTLYLPERQGTPRNRGDIWSLSDCNGLRTHNHLVRKWTLNHSAKLAKWLSCVVSTYLYSAFGCVFLSCHVRVLEWIHTL